MSRVSLTFTKINGEYVSDIFTVETNTAIHIEKKFTGSVRIAQRTGFDDSELEDTSYNFDETYEIPDFIGSKDVEIIGYVYPKQVKLICPVIKDESLPSETPKIKGYYIA